MKLYILIAIFFIGLFNECKEEKKVLPPETQTGSNTLGFYIDNELVSHHIRPGGYIKAEIEDDIDWLPSHLRMDAFLSFRGGYAELLLMDSVMEVNNTHTLYYASFFDRTTGKSFYAFNDGEITLTRLDTVNKIVSGTFAFKGKYGMYGMPDVQGDSVVLITQGRFDISHLRF